MPKKERSWGQDSFVSVLLFDLLVTMLIVFYILECSPLCDASTRYWQTWQNHRSSDRRHLRQITGKPESGTQVSCCWSCILWASTAETPGGTWSSSFHGGGGGVSLRIYTEALSSQKPPPATPLWSWIPQTWIKSFGSIPFTLLSALVCKSQPSQLEGLGSSELTVSGCRFLDSATAGQLLPQTQMSSTRMPDSPGWGVVLVTL